MMENKPAQATGYYPATTALARSTALYLATKLGDLRDDFVIVGGLVPSLIIPPTSLPLGASFHVGTMDVDFGLAIAVLDDQRYRELRERLLNAGLRPDVNAAGRPTNQRWRVEAGGRGVTVDFLIAPSLETDRAGSLRHFEEGFAAIITPGLELAFEDRRLVTLTGETISGEPASRDAWVCEAGAFVVLKALAFDGRGENKDAYDLIYLLQYYGGGIKGVHQRIRPLLRHEASQLALHIVERDFASMDSLGTARVAAFLGDSRNDTIRADAAAAARSLLRLCRENG